MKPFSYYDTQAMETWWDQAHEKNSNNFKNARVIVSAPDESDLHELTLFCIRVLKITLRLHFLMTVINLIFISV